MTLAGTLPLYSENGKKNGGAPTRKLVVWWNLEPAQWFSALGNSPVPAVRGRPVEQALGASVPNPNPCHYRLSFRVPRTPPGVYLVTILYYGGGGASSLPAAKVTVSS